MLKTRIKIGSKFIIKKNGATFPKKKKEKKEQHGLDNYNAQN